MCTRGVFYSYSVHIFGYYAGVCGGANSTLDCSGKCFGTAAIDDCNVCAGGATGILPNGNKDCKGVCFGNHSCSVQRMCCLSVRLRHLLGNTLPCVHFFITCSVILYVIYHLLMRCPTRYGIIIHSFAWTVRGCTGQPLRGRWSISG